MGKTTGKSPSNPRQAVNSIKHSSARSLRSKSSGGSPISIEDSGTSKVSFYPKRLTNNCTDDKCVEKRQIGGFLFPHCSCISREVEAEIQTVKNKDFATVTSPCGRKPSAVPDVFRSSPHCSDSKRKENTSISMHLI